MDVVTKITENRVTLWSSLYIVSQVPIIARWACAIYVVAVVSMLSLLLWGCHCVVLRQQLSAKQILRRSWYGIFFFAVITGMSVVLFLA